MIANLTETSAFIAVIVALGAFWVSWQEARRNSKVMVKLKKFSSHETYTGTGIGYELEVWVVNCGMQIQDISMVVSFYGPGMSGSCGLPIPLSLQSKGAASTFLRGTTARFLLSSADKDACRMLAMLSDFNEQRPVINLYNSSFLARSFPIYRRWDWFKTFWNRLSFRLSFQRRVGQGHQGKGVFKTYQLPYFVIRSEKLRFFLDGVKKAGADNTCAT